MAITEFEIVMLDNGEIALQKSGTDRPLVRINFSPEVLDYLGQHQVEIARCMMDAGIQAVTDLNDEMTLQGSELFEPPQTLH